ncbi:MAG TPA: CHASE2 domain-containing protein [Spirochaetota bacterium]|nr:CHASE2 domain-containing protein [Spirochaetota bacterium]HPJ43238.1 CHASE2 domain-containing protein [Spirochaetota bacterium]
MNWKNITDRLNDFFEKNKFSGLIIGLAAFLLILPFSFTDAYNLFELKLYDLRFQAKPSIPEWDRLYFVDIDENSTTALGQFPWTRDIYAEGLKVMKELGTSQISFDIMFPDPSPVQINDEAYKTIENKAASKAKVVPEDVSALIKNNDTLFAQSLKDNGSAIIAYTFTGDPLTPDAIERQKAGKFQDAMKRFTAISSIPVPQGREKEFESLKGDDTIAIVYPIPELMSAAKTFGFVNRFTDIDGTIRRVRLVQMFDGRIYFNLALSMLIDACNVKQGDIEVNPGRNIILKNAFNTMDHKIENIVIPIDKSGMIYVNWAGPGPREESFHILPFFALLEYPKFSYGVYDFFDSAAGLEGIHARMENESAISSLEEKYHTAKDNNERKSIWNDIAVRKEALKKEKLAALDMLKTEKKKLEEKQKSENPGNAAKELAVLEEDIKAVELVIRTEALKGKIAIIGLTATGTHDIASIPLHNEYPGVGTYHNTINTIINREFIKKPGGIFTFILILVTAAVSGLIMQRLASRRSLAVAIVGFFVINLLSLYLFAFHNVWIEQLGLNLALIIPSIVIVSIKLVSEESQKRFIKGAFSRYIAPDVIEQIMEHPESLELGGENRRITTFFSDVAGFSTISEKLTPPELVKLLNEYLSEMTDIIISHGGTIDKYEGDAIMAFYGAPHPYVDHELRACLAAIDMKKRLRELQEHWRNIGQHELFVRMGMNTGMAVVGNMGSRMRMDYTAMGDSVNLASRLEGANKVYGTTAMISENTYNAVKEHVETRRLDFLRVVGKTEPIGIFELLGMKGSLPQKVYDALEHYNKGMDYFRERQWKRAMNAFHDALKILPDDGPSKTYVKRCEEFMKKPPSQKWDGVYTMKSK